MSIRHYHLLAALAASVSLLIAGCSSDRAESDAPAPKPTAAQTASSKPDEIDTESNIWMVLGMTYGAIKTRGLQAELVNFDIPPDES